MTNKDEIQITLTRAQVEALYQALVVTEAYLAGEATDIEDWRNQVYGNNVKADRREMLHAQLALLEHLPMHRFGTYRLLTSAIQERIEECM